MCHGQLDYEPVHQKIYEILQPLSHHQQVSDEKGRTTGEEV